MDAKELSKIVQQSGVVGAGGAGFPTYAKLSEKAEIIIMNCAECEPLLQLHRQLMELYAEEILDTFHFIAQVLLVKQAIIGIKKDYKDAVSAIQQIIGTFPEMKVHFLENVYPMGDEIVLIYETTRKVIRPGGLPIEEGVAVFNVETVYNIHRALNLGTPVIDKLVTVVGEVAHPITVRVPIGCTIKDTVSLAGEITTKNPIYLTGGPMMGKILQKNSPITKTTNAIIVLPKDHLIVQRRNRTASIDINRAASCCCQCRTCTDLCPRHELGHPIEPHKFMRSVSNKDFQDINVFLNTMYCSSCGLCEMYSCPQGLSPRTLISEYKNGLKNEGVKPPKDGKVVPVQESREYRKAPEERLQARLGLSKYKKEASLCDELIEMDQVKVMMRQHIGAPSLPVVSAGDVVSKGQIIGRAAGGLSVDLHAPISGKVTKVAEDYIIIRKEGNIKN